MSQTLPDLLDQLTKLLVAEGHFGYLQRPIPHDIDVLLRTIVRSYQESSEDEQALLECLPEAGASAW